MKHLFAVAVSLCAAVALAAESKEDVQKKVDEASAKSCELAKKNVMDHKDACGEAAAALEPVDCASKDSRKSVDFLKLNVECAKKMKEASKGGAAKADEKTAAGKGSHCKVLDEGGAVVAEHDSEGSTIKCQGEIREKVKTEKCESGKKLAFQYVGEASPGKEGKPIAMNITCPKK